MNFIKKNECQNTQIYLTDDGDLEDVFLQTNKKLD